METTNTTTNDNSVIVESPMSTSSNDNNNNSVLSNEVSTPGPTPVEEDKHHNDFAQQMTDSIYDVHAHASEMMQIDSNANDSTNAIDTNDATEKVETTDSANNNAAPLSPQVVKEQLKYCQRILKGLKRHREAGPFLLPVDPVALNIPDYFTVIKQPMDLSTVSKKLDLNEYATADAFMADVRLMLTNCFTYNAPDSQVTKMGRNIEKYFNTSMAKMASEISGGAVSGDSNTSGNHAANMMKSQTSSSSLARPKRESVSAAAPAVRRGSSSSASLTFCSSVLRELMKKTNAHLNWPFMIPVDPVALNLPDYFDVVKTPMDLGTIRKKLDTGMYARPDQFEADVHLVFSNCYAYNPPESDVTRMGRELEAIFQQKMSQKPAPKAPAAAAVSHAVSASSVASSSSVSLPHSHHHGNFIPSSASQLIPGLDSLEDDSEKILAINHQIQILQAELNYLLINRKSSSSASLMSHRNNASSSLDNNNKSTASAGKPRKKASPASSSNLSSKASPPVMSDISFEEKRQLSEDVSNLSQDNMMRVLEIIQECMPNLNSSGDSEVIELDIEALDVRTLRALQQYIWECMNPGKKRKMTKSPAPPQSSTINSSQIPQSTTSTATTSNTTTTAAPQDKKPKLESSDQQANFDSSSSSSSEDDD